MSSKERESKQREERARETTRDPRWKKVVARDREADGTFFYSVETTGVFCRPSCGSRTPRPENVAFHATTQDAERAGFRACKRCKPTEASLGEGRAKLVADLCRFIEASEETPTLDELATRAGLSVYHLHRIFKEVTGLTPRAFADARRAERMRKGLDSTSTVTSAIYDAGYGSQGRFYAASNGRLGMTPSTYRKKGADVEIRFAVGECSLGSILVAASERGICAILLGDDPEVLVRDLQDTFESAELVGADRAFERMVAKVVAFVEAPRVGLDLPLDLRGTAFQERVWRALSKIPAGSTASYTDVARRIRSPQSVRAVARACATNQIAVAIPCHRVVRSDGGLAGYRWGVERKQALLEREASS